MSIPLYTDTLFFSLYSHIIQKYTLNNNKYTYFSPILNKDFVCTFRAYMTFIYNLYTSYNMFSI